MIMPLAKIEKEALVGSRAKSSFWIDHPGTRSQNAKCCRLIGLENDLAIPIECE